MLFEKITHNRTADAVTEQIELLILQGILRPGDRLPGERELSGQVDVSRPILREALKALEERGLLVSRHGEGTFVADLMGIFGGLIVGKFFLGLGFTQYLQHTFDAVKLQDFITGLIKAGVFGTLISGIACFLGLGVTGGAQGVGVATTRTVVLTIVALIIVDLMFTSVFYAIGW